MRVDGQVAGGDGARDAQRAADVAGPQGAGEPVGGVVGESDRVFLVVEREHDGDGAEDLLRDGGVVGGDAGEDGRREPEARPVGCAAPYRRPVFGDVSAYAFQLDAGDQRTHLGLPVRRVADDDRPDGGGEEFEEPVVRGALHEDAGTGAAVLSGVVEEGHRGLGRRALDVGVGEDDVGALAAEFEGHALEEARSPGHDLLADAGGAGEDDLGDARVFDQCLTGDVAGARQYLEQMLGQPCLQGEFGQPQGGQRGGLGGLEEYGVACRQRRRGAPGGDGHGEVPRGDDADDAERFEEGDVEPARDRDLAAGQALHSPGGVVEEVADVARLPAGVAEGVARLLHLQPGEFLDVVIDDGGEAAQQPRAVGGGRRRPPALGAGGPYDGRVDLGGAGRGHGGDDLLGRRVEDLMGVGLVGHGGVPHMRSKERRSSQSVTAAS